MDTKATNDYPLFWTTYNENGSVLIFEDISNMYKKDASISYALTIMMCDVNVFMRDFPHNLK